MKFQALMSGSALPLSEVSQRRAGPALPAPREELADPADQRKASSPGIRSGPTAHVRRRKVATFGDAGVCHRLPGGRAGDAGPADMRRSYHADIDRHCELFGHGRVAEMAIDQLPTAQRHQLGVFSSRNSSDASPGACLAVAMVADKNENSSRRLRDRNS